jgi:hypothetical protein
VIGQNGANGTGTLRRATATARSDGAFTMIQMKATRMTMTGQIASAYLASAVRAGSARIHQFNR